MGETYATLPRQSPPRFLTFAGHYRPPSLLFHDTPPLLFIELLPVCTHIDPCRARPPETPPTVAGTPPLRHLHRCELKRPHTTDRTTPDRRDRLAIASDSANGFFNIPELASSVPVPQQGDNACLRKSTDLNAGGIFMVHSFDMPAATAAAGGDADAGRRVSNGGGGNVNGVGGGKRYSVEETAPPAVEALPGGWPKTPMGLANGDVKEGIGGREGSVLSVPNGFSPQERASSAKSVALSSRSRRSSQMEDGKKSGETVKESVPRLGVAEEGYFQQPLPNGKPAAPVKTSSSKPALASSNTDATSTNASQRSNFVASPITPHSALAPVEESSPAQTSSHTGPDGKLRPPGSTVHRASSPPAFHHPNSPMSNSSQPSTSATV